MSRYIVYPILENGDHVCKIPLSARQLRDITSCINV